MYYKNKSAKRPSRIIVWALPRYAEYYLKGGVVLLLWPQLLQTFFKQASQVKLENLSCRPHRMFSNTWNNFASPDKESAPASSLVRSQRAKNTTIAAVCRRILKIGRNMSLESLSVSESGQIHTKWPIFLINTGKNVKTRYAIGIFFSSL